MSRPGLVLAAVTMLILATGCADDVAPAARVGNATITHEEQLDEAEEWAGNDQTQRSLELGEVEVPSAYALSPVASILQDRITFEIASQAFDELGLELDDAVREQAAALFFGEGPQAEVARSGFSESFIDRYVEGLARGLAVQAELGEEAFGQRLIDGGRDVEINARYGEWDPDRLTVIPPAGPRPAPEDSVSAEQ